MPGKLFVISAPSGAGKTTLVDALLKKLGSSHDIRRVVTYTSRMPRGKEEEGRDFHYLSTSAFIKKIDEGFFIEWSNGLGHYYGTQKSILEDLAKGRSCILVIDRPGAFQVLSTISTAILIWIEVSTLEVLEQRLVARGTEEAEQIAKRMKRAAEEIAEEREKRRYHHHIYNDVFDLALQQLEEIVLVEMKRAGSPESDRLEVLNDKVF